MLYATNAQDPIPVPSSAASGAAATTAIVPTNEHLERVKKSQFILEKYPDRVPLIITPSKTDRNLYPIDKSKYITPRELSLLQLQQIIRKRIQFPPKRLCLCLLTINCFRSHHW